MGHWKIVRTYNWEGNYLKVTIKRNTGVMGGLANISLFVDEEERMKLQKDEEQMMMIDKHEIDIQVKQWFLRSRKVKVTRDERLEIKINPLSVALYIIAIFILILAVYSQGGSQQLLFASVGFVMITLAIFSSLKSYFILESSPLKKDV